ncbi:dual specificity protein kinase ttk [Anaeramoeba flamelloides]|uniref:Dual specificity protein kinase ttk n=1 Tax=Anaeramoeba flamelloides TaxID=1746091 RepID=A0AAV7YGI3_9EUKA|nr:dual specificity protein kinase ttk [Anaeramoeba flamelloides]
MSLLDLKKKLADLNRTIVTNNDSQPLKTTNLKYSNEQTSTKYNHTSKTPEEWMKELQHLSKNVSTEELLKGYKQAVKSMIIETHKGNIYFIKIWFQLIKKLLNLDLQSAQRYYQIVKSNKIGNSFAQFYVLEMKLSMNSNDPEKQNNIYTRGLEILKFEELEKFKSFYLKLNPKTSEYNNETKVDYSSTEQLNNSFTKEGLTDYDSKSYILSKEHKNIIQEKHQNKENHTHMSNDDEQSISEISFSEEEFENSDELSENRSFNISSNSEVGSDYDDDGYDEELKENEHLQTRRNRTQAKGRGDSEKRIIKVNRGNERGREREREREFTDYSDNYEEGSYEEESYGDEDEGFSDNTDDEEEDYDDSSDNYNYNDNNNENENAIGNENGNFNEFQTPRNYSQNPNKNSSTKRSAFQLLNKKRQFFRSQIDDQMQFHSKDPIQRIKQTSNQKQNENLMNNNQNGINKDKLNKQPVSGPFSKLKTITVNAKTYIILKQVGRGGSSKVFKVLSKDFTSIYALKKVYIKGIDPKSLELYKNEIILLEKLKGKKNIIQLIDYEINKKKGIFNIILEFGEIDLAKKLDLLKLNSKNGIINPNFLRLTWQQMLEAVHTIHEQRIIHGDLKPANFLFVEGTLKLIDFGIAKAIQNDTTNIERQGQVGTLNYMSPEAIIDIRPQNRRNNHSQKINRLNNPNNNNKDNQSSIKNNNSQSNNNNQEFGNDNNPNDNNDQCLIKVSRASDIWSLGCILYQMVYGYPPFSNLSMFQKIRAIVDPQHKIHFPHTKDPYLTQVISMCLQKAKNNRPLIPFLLQHPYIKPLSNTVDKSVPFNDLTTPKKDLNNNTCENSNSVQITQSQLHDIMKICRQVNIKINFEGRSGQALAKYIFQCLKKKIKIDLDQFSSQLLPKNSNSTLLSMKKPKLQKKKISSSIRNNNKRTKRTKRKIKKK